MIINRKLVLGGFGALIVLLGAFIYLNWIGYLEASFVLSSVTSVLVLVTAISVTLNLFLLEENRISRQRDIEPSLSVYLAPIASSAYGIMLENIGNGPAKDINIKVNLSPQGEDFDFNRKNLREGDRVMIPDRTSDIGKSDIAHNKVITIHGDCEDMFGQKISVDDQFELDQFEPESHDMYDPFLDESDQIIQNLRRIRTSIDDIGKAIEMDGFEKLVNRKNREVILELLRDEGPQTPREISEKIGLSTIDVSESLMWLKDAGSVTYDVEAKEILKEEHNNLTVKLANK